MEHPKLRKTCERIVALEDNFILKMGSFTSLHHNVDDHQIILSGEHPCGTTYCIAGILAHLDGYPEQYSERDRSDFDYHAYIIGSLMDDIPGSRLTHYHYNEWLFSSSWPNSLEYAKIRAQYLLDHDFRIPEVYQYTDEYLDRLTDKVSL